MEVNKVIDKLRSSSVGQITSESFRLAIVDAIELLKSHKAEIDSIIDTENTKLKADLDRFVHMGSEVETELYACQSELLCLKGKLSKANIELIVQAEVPCMCGVEYKASALTDPYCPYCNWAKNDIAQAIIKLIEKGE